MPNKRQDIGFGKVEYVCLDQLTRKDVRPKPLTLTLIDHGDEGLLDSKGLRALRHRRIMRLTSEASEQGVLLSYDDLSALLLTSLATLKRDISYLETRGLVVMLKGRRKNGTPVRPVPGLIGEDNLCLGVGK